MAKIEHISGAEVLDSRGIPTIRATVYAAGGIAGVATVPSGASTGKYEAKEMRDGDTARYFGMGVQKAIANITTGIQAALLGKDTANQAAIDASLVSLDGTESKSRLGANAILAVSLACARAEAAAQGLPLYLYLKQLLPNSRSVMPVPQMNLINGGKHANNKLSIQEFHVVPAGAATFSDALRMGVEVYHALKKLLDKDGFQTSVGDEGGFAPSLERSDSAFAYLVRAIEEAGYTPGEDVWLGIDAAASEFFDGEYGMYRVDGELLPSSDLSDKYWDWRQQYPLVSIEDPFEQDDWKAWQSFFKTYADNIQIVGDDLYVTNPRRIKEGVVRKTTNAVLIKPNQIGTLSETLEAIALTHQSKQTAVLSHRSGDTEDTFIADLAIAVGAGQVKMGAPARSERTAKYNRLLEIEQSMEGVPLADDLQRFSKASQPAPILEAQRHGG